MNSETHTILSKTNRLYALLLLSLAALLKLVVYFQNRSLFLDELNLSRNIVEKPYSGLFGALDYEQFAPPLYSCAVKLCTQLFGINEYSLRLFPLLLGFASLYLIYQLALKLFDNQMILYPLILFGFSIFMLRYTTENKQYSCDVFFTLLFIFICCNYKISSLRHYLSIGMLGAIGIWFSMPLVFVLAGVGGFLFYEGFIQKKHKKETTQLLYILLVGVMWLLSFALLFYVNLQESIGSEYLQKYHKDSYLLLPTSTSNLRHSIDILKYLLASMVGRSKIALIWAVVCVFAGMYSLVKKHKGKAIVFLLPVAICFLASILRQFILIPRVCLFLMPIVFILVGLGAAVFYEQIMKLDGLKKYATIFIIGIPIGFTIHSQTGAAHFINEYELEHSRPVLQSLHEHPENNLPVYVIHNAVPAYKFYTQLYEPNIEVPASIVQYGLWSDQLPLLANAWKEQGIRKIWIFDSHTFKEELIKVNDHIKQIGETKAHFQAKSANCYLIELN